MRAGLVWPGPDERRLLSRFYLAVGLSRALYLIFPFEFAYLYLSMDRPEWAVLPLVAMSGTALVAQLPTGVVADRWSRKTTVLLGGALSAGTYVAVPFATRLDGTAQLVGVCSAFALVGLGETFMTGAQEAWVVDNLRHADREDLVETFFARTYTVTSLGGAIAGAIALALLLLVPVDRALLDLLWYTTAVGFLLAVTVALAIEEHRVESYPRRGRSGRLGGQGRDVLRVLVRTRPLLFLTVAIVIAALSGAAADEAFPVSLLTKGLDARALAPLGIADDLLGMAAPVLGLVLARRFGPEQLLARALVFAAAAVSVLFVTRTVAVVVVLFVVLGFVDRMWDPVSLARIQRDIPSEHRAALNSLVYQANGLAQLAGLALFGMLLGRHSEELRNVTPDLVDAFSGTSSPMADVPTGLFGLPVPDLAIVVFIFVGVLAVPFLVLARRASGRPGGKSLPEPPRRRGSRR